MGKYLQLLRLGNRCIGVYYPILLSERSKFL